MFHKLLTLYGKGHMDNAWTQNPCHEMMGTKQDTVDSCDCTSTAH
jgi:hypothetical protein